MLPVILLPKAREPERGRNLNKHFCISGCGESKAVCGLWEEGADRPE